MKNITLALVFSIITIYPAFSQNKVYLENNGEIIFSFADVEYMGRKVPTNMRFTMFLHLGQNVNYDFTKNIGMYTGYGLRNIGFITEENDIKIKRRTYALGIPLALKVGSFPDHFYIYAGGSYELFFHYKQKMFQDGVKSKYSEWFSDRTERFVPSVFAGVQFPGGINLKFKYYLKNFLNRDFRGYDFNVPVDYAGFNQTRIMYFALTFNFRSDQFKNITNPIEKSVRYASYKERN